MAGYDVGIEECKRAIEVDPSFGNPYNDIGAYLIELERLDEAIPWLERAISAPRYCCYFYAHTNLARVYLQKSLREKARRALRQALDVNPEYEPAQELLRRIERESGYFGCRPRTASRKTMKSSSESVASVPFGTRNS